MTVERPRFRIDLVATPVEEEGVRYVDVTDPNSGSTFRFYDVEYSIACAMDGERNLEGLAEWTRAELGIETSPDELAGVVTTLFDLGYLEAAAAAASDPGHAHGGNGASVVDFPVGSVVDSAAATSPVAGDGGLELGPPGGTPGAARESSGGADLELGAPGGSDTHEMTAAPAGVEAASVELGAPGASVHEARTREMHVMPPAAKPRESEVAELSDSAMIEIEPSKPAVAATSAAPPPPEDEMSFAGIMGDEDRAAAAKAATPPPPARRSTAHAGDEDEDTKLPGAMVDDDDENVSVDLSAHVGLDRNEVKEAVRASKVMMVPEIPKDLLDEAEQRDAAGKAVSAAEAELELDEKTKITEPDVLKAHVAATAATDKDTGSLSALSQAAQAAMPLPPPPEVVKPPAIKLPSGPPTSRPIEPTKAPPGVSGARPAKKSGGGMIYLLLLLVLAAGGLAVWKFVLNKDEDAGYSSKPGNQPAQPVKTDPGKTDPHKVVTDPGKTDPHKVVTDPGKTDPNKVVTDPGKTPAMSTAKLEAREAAAATDVTSPIEGVVESTPLKGAAVTAGAAVVRFVGAGQAEFALRDAQGSLRRHTDALKMATDAKDDAGIKRETKTVEDRQAKVDAAQAAVDKLIVKAPVDGTVEPLKKAGDKVAAGDVVAKIAAAGGAPALVGTFDVGSAAAQYSSGSNCMVAPKGKLDQATACVVEKVDGTQVTIHVVAGGTLPVKAGDEVMLVPIKK